MLGRMSDDPGVLKHEPGEPRRGWLGWWHRTPLYARILWALGLGVLAGVVLGERAGFLAIPSRLILRLLAALAPPLILLAVVRVLMTSHVTGRMAGRLFWLLALNQAIATLSGIPREEQSWIYLLRVAAFTLIIIAVVRKNLRAAPRP